MHRGTIANIPIVSRARKLSEPGVRLPVIAELRLSEILTAARKLIEEAEPHELLGVAKTLGDLARMARAKSENDSTPGSNSPA